MDTRGGVLVRGLWERQTGTIIDVKIGDAGANTYRFDPIVMLLGWWEKNKNDNNGNHFHDQWKKNYLLVISFGIMLGREALVILADLSRLMSEKMYEPILHV